MSVRGTLLRVFVDEDDRYGSKPLYQAVVESLKGAGFSGATVLKAVEGFGISGRVHSLRTVEYTTSLPVLIEVIERDDKVRAFVPRLRSMVAQGLITLECVELVRFQWGERP